MALLLVLLLWPPAYTFCVILIPAAYVIMANAVSVAPPAAHTHAHNTRFNNKTMPASGDSYWTTDNNHNSGSKRNGRHDVPNWNTTNVQQKKQQKHRKYTTNRLVVALRCTMALAGGVWDSHMLDIRSLKGFNHSPLACDYTVIALAKNFYYGLIPE